MFYEEELEKVKSFIKDNPECIGEILKLCSGELESYKVSMERKRSSEAVNAVFGMLSLLDKKKRKNKSYLWFLGPSLIYAYSDMKSIENLSGIEKDTIRDFVDSARYSTEHAFPEYELGKNKLIKLHDEYLGTKGSRE